MFKFLKDKVKSVISSISKKIDEEAPEEIKEVVVQEPPKIEEKKVKPKKKDKILEEIKEEIKPEEVAASPQKKEILEEPVKDVEIKEEPEIKKGFFSKLKKKLAEKEVPKEEPKLEIKEPIQEEVKSEEKKGFFQTITEKVITKKIDEAQFQELFWDLELALLESNVALEVVEKIKADLKEKLVNQPLKRSEVQNIISNGLRESIRDLFNVPPLDLIKEAREKKPLVICLVGINGSGKTTTLAKLAHHFQQQKFSVVIAAADTFRAAAIAQLEEHAKNLNVKLIKHEYGSDSAAVAFDAIKHAEARGVDIVLIDTAGRLHSNKDLMNEMKKLIKVAKPDLKIFIGESITGNDCVTQAKEFDESIGIDGIILAKADVDEKGGAAISVSYVTKKPILYFGTGQTYDNLEPFAVHKFMEKLGL